jgi:uncharacterized protein YutD
MDKIFIWWYCEKDHPNEMLKYARFNLVEAKTEEEAIKIIDNYIEENEYCSYACLYKKSKISIGMMETNYVQTTVLEWDKPTTNDN